jgi:hypothetical protein
MATLDDIRERESRHVLQTYKRQPVAFVRGVGSRLYDVDGREYLDFVSGIGVTALGHAHPGLTAAIADQAATLLHTSNLYYHPYQAEAAARLAQLSGLSRTFFCNSGTEAVEACLKFARRYWYTQGAPQHRELSPTLRAAHRTGDLHRSAHTRRPGGGGHRRHSGDHRGAHPWRRRRPSAVATVRLGHQRCLCADRYAVHR